MYSPSTASTASSSVRGSVLSLSSNPESPVSNEDCKDGDIEFSTKAYLNELLENGFKEERFRIDRKKLEDMLQQSSNKTIENAEDFFQRIMLETETQISWPSKLKIGAKSKKDPHVKIVGKPESVQMAKEKILEILDTKKNRVTLKMDVPHTDHSYIIGKGGFKIQQVMEETGCHIHFPDSNRNSTAEKSNQVSIAGQASGVELARQKIRDLLPLVFTFELPNGESVKPGEESSPAVQHIQQTYSFNVNFRTTGPLGMGSTLLIVRGCQRLLPRLRQGLALLMEYLIGSKSIPVLGLMKTEIAAQHHQFVMGPCEANLQMIMNKTGAKVIFPDNSQDTAMTYNGGVRSKSTVFIQGSFDSVCLAWQELLKCLPLVLMFDLKEGQELNPVMVNNFMEAFNINIMVRPKLKENTKSVLIRGAEKDSKILFQVRKEILGLEEEDFCPVSPKPSTFRVIETSRPNLPPLHQQSGQAMTTAESLSILSNIIQQNPQIVGILNNLSSAFPSEHQSPAFRPNILPNPMHYLHPNHLPTKNVESWINRPDKTYAFTPGIPTFNAKQMNVDDSDSGIYMPNKMFGQLDVKSEMSSRPDSSASSTSSTEATPDYRRTPNEQKILEMRSLLADYHDKKVLASKVLQQPAEGVRTPNQLWSGYGFSKSMPDYDARRKSSANNSGSISEYLESGSLGVSNVEAAAAKAWNTDLTDTEPVSPFASSNFWENVPRKPNPSYGSIKNLEQLMCLLDLEKFNDLFAQQEIDLPTFLTLTEMDLQQLQINYAARRKMLAAISMIRTNKTNDWPSRQFRAAPGAERKTFSRCSGINEENDRI